VHAPPGNQHTVPPVVVKRILFVFYINFCNKNCKYEKKVIKREEKKVGKSRIARQGVVMCELTTTTTTTKKKISTENWAGNCFCFKEWPDEVKK
jgi:hypothetical protein